MKEVDIQLIVIQGLSARKEVFLDLTGGRWCRV